MSNWNLLDKNINHKIKFKIFVIIIKNADIEQLNMEDNGKEKINATEIGTKR